MTEHILTIKELKPADYETVLREADRHLQKCREIVKKGIDSPISRAALRRHQINRTALLMLYREKYYKY